MISHVDVAATLNLFTWKVWMCFLKVVSVKGFILLWTQWKAVICIPHSSALHADPTVVGNKIDSPVGDSSSAGRKELKHIKSSFALSVFWVCFSSCLMSHFGSSADLSLKISFYAPWLHMSSFHLSILVCWNDVWSKKGERGSLLFEFLRIVLGHLSFCCLFNGHISTSIGISARPIGAHAPADD